MLLHDWLSSYRSYQVSANLYLPRPWGVVADSAYREPHANTTSRVYGPVLTLLAAHAAPKAWCLIGHAAGDVEIVCELVSAVGVTR